MSRDRMSWPGWSELLLALVLSVVVAACGESPSDQGKLRILEFTVSPETLDAPAEVTISWRTRGATSIELLLNDAALPIADPEAAAGSEVVFIEAPSVVELVATGADGSVVRRSRNVELAALLDPPVIGTFFAPATVAPEEDGAWRATLSWSGVVGARRLSLEREGKAPLELDLASTPDGSLEVELGEDTSFTLVAANEAGEARKSRLVRIQDPPLIETFEVDRAWVGFGDPVEVRWTTARTAAVELWIDGELLEEDEPLPPSGVRTIPLFLDAEIELRAIPEAGAWVAHRIEVRVGNPEILSFESAPPWLDLPVALSWITAGATHLELRDGLSGELLFETADAETIDGSTFEEEVAEPGALHFELAVSNGSGRVSRLLEVFVAEGPRIESFVAAPAHVNVGEEVSLSWVSAPDPDGALPTVRIVGGQGERFDDLPPEGSLSVILRSIGAAEFTLTATSSSPRSVPAVATAVAEAHGPPSVSLAATPTYFDEVDDGSVALSWEAENVSSLRILQIPEGGEPVEILDRRDGDLRAGTFHHVPSLDSTYRILVDNGAGAQAQDEVTVTLAPPRIVSFTAEPEEIVAGESVLLSWKTSQVHEVELDILRQPYLLEETSEPFIDLALEGGTFLPATGDCGASTSHGHYCVDFPFPPGFAFPFGGEVVEEVRIFSNGVIGLGAGALTYAPTNQKFVGGGPPRLAPFWGPVTGDPRSPHGDGNTFYALRGGPEGAHLIIQWKGVRLYRETAGAPTAELDGSLDFQVILWEDGSFEYRYGAMEQGRVSAEWPAGLADGRDSTIGWQHGQGFGLLAYADEVSIRGHLSHRSFRFRRPPALEASGSFRWYPYAVEDLQRVELRAIRRELEARTEASVRVLPGGPSLEIAFAPEGTVEVGEAYRIGWFASNATLVELLDGTGAQVCRSESAAEVASGYCNLVETAEGLHRYRLRAHDTRNTVTEAEVEIVAGVSLEIESFQASTEIVDFGGALSLSWATKGAAQVRLEGNGVELHTEVASSGEGSFQIPRFEANTTFRLIATGPFGATAEETLTVEVRRLAIELTPTVEHVRPGDPFTVVVNRQGLDGAEPTIYGNFPMSEVIGGPGFVDIAANPASKEVTPESVVSFPAGFTFPYFGQDHSSVRISLHGAVGFRSEGTISGNNVMLPSATPANLPVQIAPFWDALDLGSSGAIRTLHDPIQDAFVIQWEKLSRSPAAPEGTSDFDLNFQLVLFRDGSFEFRYGRMDPPAFGGRSCGRGNCAHEADGASATIGYQDLEGNQSSTLHYGQALPAIPFPGGLANRSFRYEVIRSSGPVTLYPTSPQDLFFCGVTVDGPVCETIAFRLDFGIQGFAAEDEVLQPGSHTHLVWKTFGGRELTIKEDGVVIYSTSELAEVDEGGLRIEPTKNSTYVLELAGTGHQASATTAVLVELIRLSAAASGGSTKPGDPVTVSWSLDRIAPGASPEILAPMEERSDLDFYDLDLETRDATVLIGGNQSHTLLRKQAFPEGFTFNYLGREVSEFTVSTAGYLSFRPTTAVVVGDNQPFPVNTLNYGQVHIAPFWEHLHTRVSGRVLGMQIDEDRYVVQWSRLSLFQGANNTNEGNLNFMVVLHRNGDFEFRYGRMEAPPIDCSPLSCVPDSNGSSATIGYQEEGGRAGSMIHFGGSGRAANQQPVAGGLAHRAWKFTRKTVNGSVQVTPGTSRSYQVCALDAASQGVYCAAPLEIEKRWGIASFEASEGQVLPGESVTLHWEVEGLDELRLSANGVEIASYAGSEIPSVGAFVHQPSEVTEYVLEASSLGRPMRRSLEVEVRSFDLLIRAPTDPVLPGQTVRVEWELTPRTGGPAVVTNPMVEVPAGPGDPGEYVDVRALSGAVERADWSRPKNGYIAIELPFDFPYFGQRHRNIHAFMDGFLSFGGDDDYGFFDERDLEVYDNQPLPSIIGIVHLAPFWDDLDLLGGPEAGHPHRSTVHSYWDLADTFIIQYSGMGRYDQATGAVQPHDLNFQLILHASGAFEFRYGKMEAPAAPYGSTSCSTPGCTLEPMGASATIGYQTVGEGARLGGYGWHFGNDGELAYDGGFVGSGPVPGGLANRTLRFEPATSGSIELLVETSTEHRVCGAVGNFLDCRSVMIHAAADPGDLLITELALDPPGGAAEQWFEIRNVGDRYIDLQGFVLESSSATHQVDRSLLVGAGEVITLAASTAVGFVPDYVYGQDFPLGRRVDSLRVVAGTQTIASTSWGTSWYIPTGQTTYLDPSHHRQSLVDGSDFSRWCIGTTAGTPGEIGAGCLHSDYDVDPAASATFFDISVTGTRLPIAGGDQLFEIPAPAFSMPFFGEAVERFWVGSNGWISFAATSPGGPGSPSPEALPRAGAPQGPLVAGFWSRLACVGEELGCFLSHRHGVFGGEEMLIVQWTGFHRAAAPGRLSFQIQLWQSGTVVVAFAEAASDDPQGSAPWRAYRGADAWIGLEAADGTTVTAHHRELAELGGRSIRFDPR